MSTVKYTNKNLQVWPNIPPNTTDIRIENNQIQEIPDSISNLKSLQRIIASNNQITTISDNLKTLSQLIDLRFNDNNLSFVPESVCQLIKLNLLILSNNNITMIPPGIGNLKTLTQLHLQKNTLETLPPEIKNLTNLTHLYLDNNPIEYLPPSIKNLKKLKHLGLEGTKLPLPANFNPTQNIQKTIDYILENQKEPPPTLNIKNAYLFENLSKTSLIEMFRKSFDKFSEQYEVYFDTISSVEEINHKTTTVLILVGFDVHANESLIFEIIERCTSLNITYKILYQKDTIFGIEDINLAKGIETDKVRKKLEQDFHDELLPFSSMDELEGLTLSVLKEHKPEVILNSLELENIGHFEEVLVKLDKHLTCIVGENGQGKSSILRALSLAIIGSDNSKVSTNSLNNLLRIKSITQEGQINYCDSGTIILKYTVDSVSYQNTITLNSKDEGRLIDIISSGDFQINSGEFNLKSLIVGFPQLRGRINQIDKIGKSPYSQPHIDDLLPLLNNNDDNRLDSFIGWIANLYGDARKEGEKYKESREYSIIEYVFEIISELTGKPISFITVQQFTPPIIMISSPDSPNGIPLNLISQGFKIVLGWVGYFIQRRLEAFPISSPTASSTEKSILIIDEIDSSIHPVWQSRLLNVLREKFPNTQIICTTHSPLMLAGLDREQILEIEQEGDKITVKQNNFDTWASSYREILRMIFDISDFIPKITKEELELQLTELSDNPDKQQEIHETIKRLISNEVYVDDLRRYEESLKEKEKELDTLIEEYKTKNQ